MFQTSKFVVTQAKAFEFAQVLAQLAINNAKVVAEIHYDASKNAMTTAQIKAGEILGTNDPKAALQIIKSEDAPVVIAEVSAVHSKVTKVIRKANKEAVELFESAMNESKADLKKWLKKYLLKHL